MAIAVIPDKFEKTGDKYVVVVESDLTDLPSAILELQTMAAREVAVKFASENGIAAPRLNGTVRYFPINIKGETINDPVGSVYRYRANVPLINKVL